MADTLQVSFATVVNATGVALIDGVNTETYTVLSLTICQTNTTETPQVSVVVTDSGGAGNPRYIHRRITMPPKSTFEHTDKIILEGTQELWVKSETGDGDIDVVCSFLKQTA